ncbi:hypothetical protein JXI42_05140 [bacterium]|nr:hypothetical protein [bacterium]
MDKIPPYPYDFIRDFAWHFSEYPRDIDGIPFQIFNKEAFYNPVLISQYALANYDLYFLHKKEKNMCVFLRCAEWLLKNASLWKNDSEVWIYTIHEKRYSLKPPWISAMAQGSAVSVLIRAYLATDDSRYLNLCEKAIIPFEFDVKDNGLRNYLNDGNMCFEEYPSVDSSCVLNGMIFTLFGLYEYGKYLGNEKAKLLFNEGIKTLESNMDLFDSGYWSLYDVYKGGHIAGRKYHSINTMLICKLGEITGESIFKEYCVRWLKYKRNIFSNIRWFFRRGWEKAFGF